jgi:YVTN family beta-propeller protein
MQVEGVGGPSCRIQLIINHRNGETRKPRYLAYGHISLNLLSIPNGFIIIHPPNRATTMISHLALIAVLFLMPGFWIIYDSPVQQVFATSFEDSSEQAIVTSNDECQPGSLVHCIDGQQQPQQKGLPVKDNADIATTGTTSPESSDGVIGQTQHTDGLSMPREFLYVGNAKSNSVAVIDLATNAIIKNITVGESPHDIKISDDQQRVYTTDIDSGTVSVINSTSNTLIDQIETGGNRAVHGIAIFNDTMYVGDVYGGKILLINDDGQIINEIKVGAGPEYVEVSPNGKFLYVANLWSPISVVDIAQNKVIKEIDSGETPHGLSFTDDGSRLFIVNMNSNTLSVIDATRHEVIKTISVGNRPEYVALTPDERFAFVTNLGSDTVSVVDVESLQVIKEIPVGGDSPHGIAFSLDGDMAYVSNMDSSDISVINVTTGQLITTFPSGGIEPHQIVLKNPSAVSIASAGSKDINSNDGSAIAVAAARQFLISKLPELGIQLQDQTRLHTDMVVAITEYEYQVDFSVIDAQGRPHEGYVEVANGQVMSAELDGRTILFSDEAL